MKEIHCEIGMIGRTWDSIRNIEFKEFNLIKGQYNTHHFGVTIAMESSLVTRDMAVNNYPYFREGSVTMNSSSQKAGSGRTSTQYLHSKMSIRKSESFEWRYELKCNINGSLLSG